ncbi:predicted protein [Postia placenta Mad-698-R]|nr:predicted protein [Postia placenta Mad-698-R]
MAEGWAAVYAQEVHWVAHAWEGFEKADEREAHGPWPCSCIRRPGRLRHCALNTTAGSKIAMVATSNETAARGSQRRVWGATGGALGKWAWAAEGLATGEDADGRRWTPDEAEVGGQNTPTLVYVLRLKQPPVLRLPAMSFLNLNNDVLALILTFVSPPDAMRLALTCHDAYSLAMPRFLSDVILGDADPAVISGPDQITLFCQYMLADPPNRIVHLRALAIKDGAFLASARRADGRDTWLEDFSCAPLLSDVLRAAHNLRRLYIRDLEPLLASQPAWVGVALQPRGAAGFSGGATRGCTHHGPREGGNGESDAERFERPHVWFRVRRMQGPLLERLSSARGEHEHTRLRAAGEVVAE